MDKVWGDVPIRGLLFDMDGVLADTFAAHHKAWEIFLRNEGFDIDAEEFLRRTFGQGNPEIFAELYGGNGALDAGFVERKSIEKESHFVELCREGRVPPVPGSPDFVARARQCGWRLAVGTSAPRTNLDTVLNVFGLEDAFDAKVSAEETARAKPAPDIFLLCCEKLGLEPGECVVFEDSMHGIQAARAAGCRVVAISTTHTAEELAPHADQVAPNFLELMNREPWNAGA